MCSFSRFRSVDIALCEFAALGSRGSELLLRSVLGVLFGELARKVDASSTGDRSATVLSASDDIVVLEREKTAYGVMGILDLRRDPSADEGAAPPDGFGDDVVPFWSDLDSLAELASSSLRN